MWGILHNINNHIIYEWSFPLQDVAGWDKAGKLR